MCERLLGYRVFADEAGRMNRAPETGDRLLLVSQFTPAADVLGHAPGFSTAAAPAEAERIFGELVAACRLRLPAGWKPGVSAPICRSAWSTTDRSPSCCGPDSGSESEPAGIMQGSLPHFPDGAPHGQRTADSPAVRHQAPDLQGAGAGLSDLCRVNDHLPDDMVDPEQIEDIIGMINGMGIEVHEIAPDAETLLLAGSSAGGREVDDTAAEGKPRPRCPRSTPRAAAPLTRCACTCARWAMVEMLTREGEIAIAKRIEEGL